MLTLPDYKFSQLIYESANSLVYRGTSETGKPPVILKILKEDYPTREELIRYRQEFEIIHELDIEGVVKVYKQEKYGNTLVMYMEDFGGSSLKILNQQNRFPLLQLIELFQRLVGTLSEIHQANVIHKDINPSNIVYNPETDQLRIIDFGISTGLPRETPILSNPEGLQGTLSYISPEQTGRMNRPLDYRTDYYALGATLYELLSGRTPFVTKDPMEMVHCHLAKMPESPRVYNSEISESLGSVVLKLLAKQAEERYQTTEGLLADLELCRREMEGGAMAGFSPGARDIPRKFQLSQKLYGREDELEILLHKAERAAVGACEVLLIAGYSGVGKSALVGEIFKPLVARRGYYTSGKFDQYHGNIPYSAVGSAIRDLMRQLLTEKEDKLLIWKERILKALGGNAGVMTEFLPELELIIEKQPQTTELGATETRNRFTLAFQEFVQVFCDKEHPLVIFLDDLQWADTASLAFMKVLAETNKHLFLIGAYRDNEVGPGHPLLFTLEAMGHTSIPLDTITVSPLGLPFIREYIVDSLHGTPKQADDLAELVKSKTDGNPFFMGEFLKTLNREGFFKYNEPEKRWICDMESVREKGISDNVVEFMSQELRLLDANTGSVMAKAACLGNIFNLSTLALIHGESTAVVAGSLWSALLRGLIVPLSDNYKIAAMDLNDKDLDAQVFYKFSHDRIQEAAYSLIPADGKKNVHLQAGRLLLKNTPSSELERDLFEIVDHLNLGSSLMDEEEEIIHLARLNLQAGRKARNSAAYDPALGYYNTGLDLLGKFAWVEQYSLTLSLFRSGAEAAYLAGNYEELERLAAIGLESAQNLLDEVHFHEILIQSHIAQNQGKQAVSTARRVLEKLDVFLPEYPGESAISECLMKTTEMLSERTPESLGQLPEMSDQVSCAAMRIMSVITVSSYQTVRTLFPILVGNQVQLSLSQGNAGESPYIYTMYGCLIIAAEEIDKGYEYGKMALELCEKERYKKYRAKVMVAFYAMVAHTKLPYADALEHFQKTFEIGKENGDLEYAASGAWFFVYFSLMAGRELGALENQAALLAESVERLGQETIHYYINIWRQTILNLRYPRDNPVLLRGEAYDERKMLLVHDEAGDQIVFAFLHSHKLMLAYLFQDYKEALINADIMEEYLAMSLGQPYVYNYYFYDSLTRLAVYGETKRMQQYGIIDKVERNQQKLKFLASHAPMNHQHRYDLVAAELARVQGDLDLARGLYEKSIDQAYNSEYLHDEALAWELAAGFYLQHGTAAFSRFCLKNAHYVYSLWGADGKINHLEKKYPEAFTSDEGLRPDNRPQLENTVSTTSGHTGSGSLDLATVMKSSRTIASEIELAPLLRKMMIIMLENAGAERGYLLLQRDDAWFVEAEGNLLEGEAQNLEAIPLKDAGRNNMLSETVVRYTARTGEVVSLNNAVKEGLFIQDEYIQKKKSRSILCVPISHRSEMVGIVYMENNLAPDVFTQDRVQMLEMLSSQAAVSIEHAHFYETLQVKLKEKHKELLKALDVSQKSRKLAEESREKLLHELRMARIIQESLLPKELPDIKKAKVAFKYEPMHEVGGDFIDIQHKGNLLGFFICDVSGHGVPAAFLASMVKMSLQKWAEDPSHPVESALQIKNTLAGNMASNYITACLGALDLSTGRVVLARAGHPPLLWLKANGKLKILMPAGNIITQMANLDPDCEELEFQMEPGDKLILFTDGITDAKSQSSDMLGARPFYKLLKKYAKEEPSVLCQSIYEEVVQFCGWNTLNDDFTLLTIQFEG